MQSLKFTRMLLFLVSFLLPACCTTEYNLSYNTYLKQSNNHELNFKDDKFSFSFKPIFNGIFFSIENLTDTTAFLIWDKSYFIKPDGNSYKAINFDIINVEEEIARKELYESILPKGVVFSRFTTPNINVDVFKKYDINEINSLFKTSINSDITVRSYKYANIETYWVTAIKLDRKYIIENTVEEKINLELDNVRNFILNNDNLGLGLAIKMNEKTYDYQFNFKFKEAKLFEECGKNQKLIRIATEKNHWNWIEVK